MVFSILLNLKESWKREERLNCTLASLTPSFSVFYKLTSPLNPRLSQILDEASTRRSTLAPRPSCLLSHPQSLFLLQGWARRAGVAAGSQGHFRPTECHPSAWWETTSGQQETKNCETNIFNTFTTRDAVWGSAAKRCGIWPYPEVRFLAGEQNI